MSSSLFAGLFEGSSSSSSSLSYGADQSCWCCPSSLTRLLDRNPPGEAVMVVVTLIYAVQSLIAKVVERRVTALELVTYRSVLAGIVTLRLLLRTHRDRTGGLLTLDERLFGRRDMRRLVVLRGLVGALAFVCLYAALHDIGIGEHTALLFTNPLVISVLARPLLGEPVGCATTVAVLCGAAGALFVAQPPFLAGTVVGAYGNFGASGSTSSREHHRLRGVALALSGAVLVALTMLVVRKVGNAVPSLCLAMSFHLYSATLGSNALALGVQDPSSFVALGGASDDDDTGRRRWWSDLGLIVLISGSSFVGQPLLNYGYQNLPAARAASLNYLQLLWAVVLGYVVIGERPSQLQLAGAGLITLGGLAVALCSSSSHPASSPSSLSRNNMDGSFGTTSAGRGGLAARDHPGVAYNALWRDDDDLLDDDTDLLGA